MAGPDLEKSRRIKLWVIVTWPAFLTACLLEAVVFAAIDPAEVHWPGQTVQPSRQAIYTAAFFCFWLIAIACSGLVVWLSKPPRDVNDTARG